MAVGSYSATAPLCWICKKDKANSGEHKTKRSDLAAVLHEATQERPLYFHDLERRNKLVKCLDAKILKSTARICHACNSARTQPHDRAWERMSVLLREREFVVGQWVRNNSIFPYDTRREMIKVQLFFLKLFGCMLEESKAVGHDVPIDIAPFSAAIMSGEPHKEVHLQVGVGDGTIGRSNLYCWKTDKGSVIGGWLYQLDRIAVGVLYLQRGRWEPRMDIWHPASQRSSKRLMIANLTGAEDGTQRIRMRT